MLAFAAVSKVLSPQRFAGIFPAAPSVALGSLAVTLMVTGREKPRCARLGDDVAAAFEAHCLATAPLARWFGAWKGFRGCVAV